MSKEIDRREFLKIVGIIGGAALLAGCKEKFNFPNDIEKESVFKPLSKEEIEKLLETDFNDFKLRFPTESQERIIFEKIPEVLSGNISLLSDKLRLGFSEEETSVEVKIYSQAETNQLSASILNRYEILKEVKWPGFIFIPEINKETKGNNFGLTYYLLANDKEKAKVGDLLPLALMPAPINVYQKGKNESEYFQNEHITAFSEGVNEIVLQSGLSVLFEGKEARASFFNLGNVFGRAFAEWVVQGRSGKQLVEASGSADFLVDFAERICKDGSLTYEEIAKIYKENNFDLFLRRVVGKYLPKIQGRTAESLNKAEVAAALINLSSLVEDYCFVASETSKEEWVMLYQNFIESYSEVMIPRIESSPDEFEQRAMPGNLKKRGKSG